VLVAGLRIEAIGCKRAHRSVVSVPIDVRYRKLNARLLSTINERRRS